MGPVYVIIEVVFKLCYVKLLLFVLLWVHLSNINGHQCEVTCVRLYFASESQILLGCPALRSVIQSPQQEHRPHQVSAMIIIGVLACAVKVVVHCSWIKNTGALSLAPNFLCSTLVRDPVNSFMFPVNNSRARSFALICFRLH